ncbi:MAG TPA: pyridoxal-phosphate dependent enzyme, partial [Bryobacteraceae bacterium]|nr:pyridoxal-phosphate dependent enzyme [Bryobacteraceae bacterium]
RSGKRISIPMPETIADGLRASTPGALTFPIVQKHVEDIALVNENQIRETMRYLLMRMKMLAEPSGAVSAAAALFHKLPAGLGRVGFVISGGNVDFEVIQNLDN